MFSFQKVSLIITGPFIFYLCQQEISRSSINKCNNQIYIPHLSLDVCSRKRAIHFLHKMLNCTVCPPAHVWLDQISLWTMRDWFLREGKWKWLFPVEWTSGRSHYEWQCWCLSKIAKMLRWNLELTHPYPYPTYTKRWEQYLCTVSSMLFCFLFNQ